MPSAGQLRGRTEARYRQSMVEVRLKAAANYMLRSRKSLSGLWRRDGRRPLAAREN